MEVPHRLARIHHAGPGAPPPPPPPPTTPALRPARGSAAGAADWDWTAPSTMMIGWVPGWAGAFLPAESTSMMGRFSIGDGVAAGEALVWAHAARDASPAARGSAIRERRGR